MPYSESAQGIRRGYITTMLRQGFNADSVSDRCNAPKEVLENTTTNGLNARK